MFGTLCKRAVPGFVLVALCLDLVSALAAPAAKIDVPAAKGDSRGIHSLDSATSGIQEAIDRLSARGGVVALPPGTYLLRRSIQLTSNVTLRGSGPSTVLKRCVQTRSALAETATSGATWVKVGSPTGFQVGAEVAIWDKQFGGWYVTHARIARIEGNTLHLDKPVTKAFDPKQGGVVLNYFPGILAVNTRGASVEDLCLDGDIANNPGPENDFTLSAVHMVRARDCLVRDCRVTGWPSDGISVQRGNGNRVLGCTVEGCRGHGLHPGTGVQSSLFSNNVSRRNAWDGLYFCMNCRYVVVSDSVFEENGWNGIGGLGDGGDKYNVVSNNVCVGNQQCGIQANNGDNNSIVGNICLNNSARKAGAYPGIRLHNVTDMTVSGNRCLDDRQEKMQSCGVEEAGSSDYNLVTGNQCRGNAQAGIRLLGSHSVSASNVE